jgi:hypothetical protein
MFPPAVRDVLGRAIAGGVGLRYRHAAAQIHAQEEDRAFLSAPHTHRLMTRVLDPIDTALAAVLARDGRAQYQALAEAVGMSRPGAKARVQRLLGEGTVRLAVIVHPALAQPATLAHVAMSVDGAAREVAEAIAARAAADRGYVAENGHRLSAGSGTSW